MFPIAQIKAAFKLAFMFFVGMLFAAYCLSEFESGKFDKHLPELTYVAISLVITGMWAVWQMQEAIGDPSILARLPRSQRNILGFKQEYSRRRVVGSIVLTIAAGIVTTFGESVLDSNSYLLLVGGCLAMMVTLFVQHLLSYLAYSQKKSELQRRIADIERKERNAQKLNSK